MGQDECLKGVETGGEALVHVHVLGRLAVLSQSPRVLGEFASDVTRAPASPAAPRFFPG